MIQIESFILKDKNSRNRNEEAFVNINDHIQLDKSKLDYDYLEGAIIIRYNDKALLTFQEWDLVDQLWLYFLNSIIKLNSQNYVEFSLPDQPYIISISVKNANYLDLSFDGIPVCIEKELFLSQILRSANIFFEKLLILFPEHSNDIIENINLIKNIIDDRYLTKKSKRF